MSRPRPRSCSKEAAIPREREMVVLWCEEGRVLANNRITKPVMQFRDVNKNLPKTANNPYNHKNNYPAILTNLPLPPLTSRLPDTNRPISLINLFTLYRLTREYPLPRRENLSKLTATTKMTTLSKWWPLNFHL
jgi:hypothetical protein